MKKEFFIGLDIGTDSIGYAVTDTKYNLLKYRGEPAWGVTIFDAASLKTERRSFRSARRRLDRRQQRVRLIQELFSTEVVKVDKDFYKRLAESSLYRNDVEDEYIFFNDSGYTDKQYHEDYPTIHHLICDLMSNDTPHDVRLVYLACAWLVAHRGHFLKNIDKNNISALTDFNSIYDDFLKYFTDNGYTYPWQCHNRNEISEILKAHINITAKTKRLNALLFDGSKPSKQAQEDFPFSQDSIVRLLCGGKVKLADLFCNDLYEDFGSFSLGDDEDKFGEIMSNIGDDYELIAVLRQLYDWTVLVDALGDYSNISAAKVAAYEQHKHDLAFLKYIVKKYIPKKYNEIFRDIGKDNYAAYAYHTDERNASDLKKKNIEAFSKYILGVLKGIEPDAEDSEKFEDMISRLSLNSFMPKQKNTDNRVLPHQLYWHELHCILQNAEKYLPFLKEKSDGLSVSEKIESVFLFKIPYFVGPLNPHSDNSWIARKAGKIYPWNFNEMVDLDASEQNFIQKMLNTCTYLPDQPVLPKCSILYQKFMVLNAINCIQINGEKIPVELKQNIFNELFLNIKKVTHKKICNYLISHNIIEQGNEDTVKGIDVTINAGCTSMIAFKRLIENSVIMEADAEKIIERSSYAEDKSRLGKWIDKMYPDISDTDKKYICSLKFNDFGRLSHKLLCELQGVNKGTGEITTIIREMWETQNNLNEILSDKYTFAEEIAKYQQNYYSENKKTLDDRLNDMYISNAVKRPIYRTFDIIKDITKAFGEPSKIFVEMTRGGDESLKGKRTKTRKQQILELYEQCKDEDVRILKQQLEEMGDTADNKLQGDKLFLYYMQLGKSMYSGKSISLEQLGSKEYDIDHIYPQAFVKDDSILNNKVLCLSSENGAKSDTYPLSEDIRAKMSGYWRYLKDANLITEEKYKRLTRNTPFTPDEKLGFINRQLTETSQSTKAVATLLKEKFPNTEIVYCKARLASEFRQEFDLLKSRTFNDLHHAADAYLNIVTGNVYNMKFTKKWFNVNEKYSVKTKTLFTRPLICNGVTVWDGENMLNKVKLTARKNNAHFTKFSYFKKGGLFDQMPVSAKAGLTPLKKNLPTEKYGGYNKAGVMFFIPVKYKLGKKTEIVIMSVELLHGDKFLADTDFAREYSFKRLEHILGKRVEEISFPMGMRPWKVNTVLSLDGFKVCIAGISNGGKTLIAQTIMQFSADSKWNTYLKRLERFSEKCSSNDNYIYDAAYDYVTKDANEELYNLYIDKLENTIYSKRINSPVEVLKKGKEKFLALDIKQQCKALLNIHQVFGRVSGGCDLTLIGGVGKAAATVFSSSISNWKKNYKCVKIIDSSASGLWRKESGNILELL